MSQFFRDGKQPSKMAFPRAATSMRTEANSTIDTTDDPRVGGEYFVVALPSLSLCSRECSGL